MSEFCGRLASMGLMFPFLGMYRNTTRVYEHLTEKYGQNGYAKTYIEDKEYEESIKKLRKALENKEEFLERVKEVIRENDEK